EQSVVGQFAVLPLVGVGSIKQYDGAFGRFLSQSRAAAFDALKFGDGNTLVIERQQLAAARHALAALRRENDFAVFSLPRDSQRFFAVPPRPRQTAAVGDRFELSLAASDHLHAEHLPPVFGR